MAAATPRSQRADARRNRERIVAAAAELFAAQGVDCQVSEIAKHAGVGNATVFRHFPAKRDLVIAVVESSMTEMLAEAETSGALDDPVAGLRRFVEGMARTFVENHGVKQMASAHFDGDERLIAIRDAMLAVLGDLVARCQAAGAIRPDVHPIDVVVLVHGVSTALLGLEHERPGLHRRYVALALAGLRPKAADGPLPMAPPKPDELEAAWHHAPGGACSEPSPRSSARARAARSRSARRSSGSRRRSPAIGPRIRRLPSNRPALRAMKSQYRAVTGQARGPWRTSGA